MSILSLERISLRASATDQTDAIRQAGELLVRSGCVLPEYLEGMLLREQFMSTSLGNGIAIPHGVYENRSHILQTGISVLQIVNGVAWGHGKKVSLVIGIAALSNQHAGVLANLANVIDNEKNLAELFSTTNPGVIMNYLSLN